MSAGFHLDRTRLVAAGTVNGSLGDRCSLVSLMRRQFGDPGWANTRLNASVACFEAENANAGRAFTDQVWGLSCDFGVVRTSVGQRRRACGSDGGQLHCRAEVHRLRFGLRHDF